MMVAKLVMRKRLLLTTIGLVVLQTAITGYYSEAEGSNPMLEGFLMGTQKLTLAQAKYAAAQGAGEFVEVRRRLDLVSHANTISPDGGEKLAQQMLVAPNQDPQAVIMSMGVNLNDILLRFGFSPTDLNHQGAGNYLFNTLNLRDRFTADQVRATLTFL